MVKWYNNRGANVYKIFVSFAYNVQLLHIHWTAGTVHVLFHITRVKCYNRINYCAEYKIFVD